MKPQGRCAGARQHPAVELAASHYPGPVGSDSGRGRGGEQADPRVPGLHTKNVFTVADIDALLPGECRSEVRWPLLGWCLLLEDWRYGSLLPCEQHSEWSSLGVVPCGFTLALGSPQGSHTAGLREPGWRLALGTWHSSEHRCPDGAGSMGACWRDVSHEWAQ